MKKRNLFIFGMVLSILVLALTGCSMAGAGGMAEEEQVTTTSGAAEDLYPISTVTFPNSWFYLLHQFVSGDVSLKYAANAYQQPTQIEVVVKNNTAYWNSVCIKYKQSNGSWSNEISLNKVFSSNDEKYSLYTSNWSSLRFNEFKIIYKKYYSSGLQTSTDGPYTIGNIDSTTGNNIKSREAHFVDEYTTTFIPYGSDYKAGTYYLEGTLYVENMSHNKTVSIVYTTDNWATQKTGSCSFQSGTVGYGSGGVPIGAEIWKYKVNVGYSGTNAHTNLDNVKFYVKYKNNDSGITYYDNNFGNNYGPLQGAITEVHLASY